MLLEKPIAFICDNQKMLNMAIQLNFIMFFYDYNEYHNHDFLNL